MLKKKSTQAADRGGVLPELPSIREQVGEGSSQDEALSSTLDGIDALLTRSSNVKGIARGHSKKRGKGLPPITPNPPSPLTVDVPSEPLQFSAGSSLFEGISQGAGNEEVHQRGRPHKATLQRKPSKTHNISNGSKPVSSSPSRLKRQPSRRKRTGETPQKDHPAGAREEAEAPPTVSQTELGKNEDDETSEITRPEPPEDDLHDIEMQARQAASNGDNILAAQICVDGIKIFGEEPTLVSIFKEACARLGVAPAILSYPSGAYVLTATRLYVGDDLPISYDVRYRNAPDDFRGSQSRPGLPVAEHTCMYG